MIFCESVANQQILTFCEVQLSSPVLDPLDWAERKHELLCSLKTLNRGSSAFCGKWSAFGTVIPRQSFRPGDLAASIPVQGGRGSRFPCRGQTAKLLQSLMFLIVRCVISMFLVSFGSFWYGMPCWCSKLVNHVFWYSLGQKQNEANSFSFHRIFAEAAAELVRVAHFAAAEPPSGRRRVKICSLISLGVHWEYHQNPRSTESCWIPVSPFLHWEHIYWKSFLHVSLHAASRYGRTFHSINSGKRDMQKTSCSWIWNLKMDVKLQNMVWWKSSQHLEMRCHFLVQTGKWIQWFHKNLRWHTTQKSRHDIDSSIGEVPGLGVLDPLVAPPSSAWNGEAVNQTVNGISQTTKCIQESISIYVYIYINLYIRCRLWDPRACGHVLFILWPNIKNQLFEEMSLFHWMDDDVCSCNQPVYLMCQHTLRQVLHTGLLPDLGGLGDIGRVKSQPRWKRFCQVDF